MFQKIITKGEIKDDDTVCVRCVPSFISGMKKSEFYILFYVLINAFIILNYE